MMPGKFHHESLYRGPALLGALAEVRIALCGVGAVGSNLADNLARQGAVRLLAIDRDRVEEHNISTQLYGESDVGTWKVEALRNHLFRAVGIEIETAQKELTATNARQLLKSASLIIDAFDNSAARQCVQDFARSAGIPCLHVGLHEDYCEVIWDGRYRVPGDVAGDVCDYPLARNAILLAVAMASEAVLRFVGGESPMNRSATLKDFKVLELDD